MSINRHNYEEYFILYMDNELNSDDRRMVEAFVLLHPDLKEELDLLQQFKLEPDTSVTFLQKEDLLKEKGEALITDHNKQEWLVLYIDNELSPTQRKKVESFITTYPSAAAELAILQKAKLQPEAIVFADKHLLYHNEEKVKPVAFKWWRAAAAILIVGIGLSTALIVTNNGKKGSTASGNIPIDSLSNNPQLVKGTMPVQSSKAQKETIPSDKEKKSPDNNTANLSVYKQAVANNNTVIPQKENRREVKQVLPEENKQAPIIVDINNKQNNNLPKPDQNPFVKKDKEETPVVIAKSDVPVVKDDNNNSATNLVVTTQAPQSSDYILASNDGKKNKNRGIFRKIARTFEKRTNIDPTEDGDKLLVAGFAINMK